MKKFCFIVVLLLNVGLLMGQELVEKMLKSGGGIGWDLAQTFVKDKSGNMFIAGGFENKAYFPKSLKMKDFLIDSLESKGDRDIYFAKYSRDGELIWLKQFGGIEYDNANCLVIDSDANIYMTGSFRDTVFFDSYKISSGVYIDNFIVKFDSSGKILYAFSIESDCRGNETFLRIDSLSNILRIGSFNNSIVAKNGIRYNSEGGSDIFIESYDKTGKLNWIKTYGGKGDDKIIDAKINEDLFITGSFEDTIHAANRTFISTGESDIFTAKINLNGNIEWFNQMGGYFCDKGCSIGFESDSIIYVTGSFEDEIVADNFTIKSNGGSDVFLAKYDLRGKLISISSFGGAASEVVKNVFFNDRSEIYVVGEYRGMILYETNFISSKELSNDIFVSKFDRTGNLKWISSIGNSGDEYNQTAFYESGGRFMLSGSFSKTLKIAQDSIVNKGNKDFFIGRFLDCDYGNKLNLGKDTSVCQSFELKVDSGYVRYKWENGSTGLNRLIKNSGLYKISVIDSLGCTFADSINIVINPSPDFNLGLTQRINYDETAIVYANRQFSSYDWSTGCKKDTLIIKGSELGAGNHNITLMATDEYNCSAMNNIGITVIENKSYGINKSSSTNFGGTWSNNSDETALEDTDNLNEINSGFLNTYPNPSDGNFMIYLTDLIKGKSLVIEVFDFAGKSVYRKGFENYADEYFEGNINLEGISSGEYTVRIINGIKTREKKIVIKM